jgi:hypothetical protein
MPNDLIAAIAPVSGSGAVTPLPAEHAHVVPSPPMHAALTEAKAKGAETLEQLAADGDALAIIKLAQEEEQAIPVDAQHPLPVDHAPGAHEPGKGDLIDIYD